jgi:hypothetical protein
MSLLLGLGSTFLIAVAVVSGCGGGDSTGTTASTTPSAEGAFAKSFVALGNEICRVTRERQKLVLGSAEEAGEIGGTTSQAEQQERLVVVVADPYATMITEFENLKIAASERAAKLALIQAFSMRLKELEVDPASGSSGEESPSGAIKLAKEYGLNECTI